jgi:hypothetical protein
MNPIPQTPSFASPPGTKRVQYLVRRADDSPIHADFWRDYAEVVLLQEFGPGEISCFMHIGDSPGEGGSNLWFLSRVRGGFYDLTESTPRPAWLLDELAERLADGAIVITDGSNVEPAFTKDQPFEASGMRWEPLGVVTTYERHRGVARVWRARSRSKERSP